MARQEMCTQSLSSIITTKDVADAAYELRRLYAVNVELLEALQTVVANAPDPYCAITRAVDAQCRAAIAKATDQFATLL